MYIQGLPYGKNTDPRELKKHAITWLSSSADHFCYFFCFFCFFMLPLILDMEGIGNSIWEKYEITFLKINTKRTENITLFIKNDVGLAFRC